jgi:hypothetical protein
MHRLIDLIFSSFLFVHFSFTFFPFLAFSKLFFSIGVFLSIHAIVWI